MQCLQTVPVEEFQILRLSQLWPQAILHMTFQHSTPSQSEHSKDIKKVVQKNVWVVLSNFSIEGKTAGLGPDLEKCGQKLRISLSNINPYFRWVPRGFDHPSQSPSYSFQNKPQQMEDLRREHFSNLQMTWLPGVHAYDEPPPMSVSELHRWLDSPV